jgi:hypothetical protein
MAFLEHPAKLLCVRCIGIDPSPVLVREKIDHAWVEAHMRHTDLRAGIPDDGANSDVSNVVGNGTRIDRLPAAANRVFPLRSY